MKINRRVLLCAALAGLIAIAGCGKTEAPPPKVEPPKPAPPAVNAELKRLAAELYVFAFPLILTDVTRQVETAETPANIMRHTQMLPDATTQGVVNPNADFLYSQAWLDLSGEPVILSVPDTRGRYYLIAMLDAWSNVAHSLGERTLGNRKPPVRHRRAELEGQAAGTASPKSVRRRNWRGFSAGPRSTTARTSRRPRQCRTRSSCARRPERRKGRQERR